MKSFKCPILYLSRLSHQEKKKKNERVLRVSRQTHERVCRGGVVRPGGAVVLWELI